MVENLGLVIIIYYRVSPKVVKRIMGQFIIYNQIGFCEAILQESDKGQIFY